ncbi:oligosaccharide flippase family protein, partial [Flavobacteriaceae bacterium]|nr:oligosaccharide flippase family protein [Flavobacteriaceae bacterium]
MKFLQFFSSNASMPTTTYKIVSTNALWLTLERVFRLSINFIVAVYLARFLGPDKFGVLSYVLSLTSFFFIFSDLGLDSIITRELVKRGISNKILSTAFIIKFIGSIFSTIVLLGLILIFQKSTYLTFFLIASPLIFLKS